MQNFLDFEKPIAELEGKIAELRHLSDSGDLNIAEEVAKLQGKADRLLRQTYAKLTPWQKTLVARHPDRPHFLDYVADMVDEFTPLAGDRQFGEDAATGVIHDFQGIFTFGLAFSFLLGEGRLIDFVAARVKGTSSTGDSIENESDDESVETANQ